MLSNAISREKVQKFKTNQNASKVDSFVLLACVIHYDFMRKFFSYLRNSEAVKAAKAVLNTGQLRWG